MARSQCTTCGLNRQNCQCSPPTGPVEITPSYCCSCYLWSTLIFSIVLLALAGIVTLLIGQNSCYFELFANSISATNANASNADWRIGFVAKSPVSGCKFSLYTLQSRLLRGGEVISEISPSLDSLGQLVNAGETDGPVTTVGFKNVVTPGVIGGVVWDFRVELVARVNEHSGHGILTVLCGGLPVKFTADPAGNVTGSLLGNMRRCEYLFRRDKWNRYV
ncbi:unnamed protein product [Arabis nemorensis]|uniref:Late embryogenesis abundant protein LEA-2 subgroup domain-containing protein n=1 Tax=Arabis nemorensis TaxID=586526 RepID=A0A565CT19_9BRAS|nr:unnamed protein product [Arabis nemorensis]